MTAEKIVGLIGLAIAIVAAFVAIPYIELVLLVIGLIVGWFIAREDTVRAFKEILEGKHDEVAEANFYMKGGITEIAEA